MRIVYDGNERGFFSHDKVTPLRNNISKYFAIEEPYDLLDTEGTLIIDDDDLKILSNNKLLSLVKRDKNNKRKAEDDRNDRPLKKKYLISEKEEDEPSKLSMSI